MAKVSGVRKFFMASSVVCRGSVDRSRIAARPGEMGLAWAGVLGVVVVWRGFGASWRRSLRRAGPGGSVGIVRIDDRMASLRVI